MVWWNKSKKIEKAVPGQPQGLKVSLDELTRKDQAKTKHFIQKLEQERREKTDRDQQEAMVLLKSQLTYCFGVDVSPQQNPTQVEGMWFGILMHITSIEGSLSWCISLSVSCKKCQALRLGYVSKIIDWDERKASAQQRFQESKKLPPMVSKPSCWEEVADIGHVRAAKMGKTHRQAWLETLADYQTSKKRELALYLRQVEDGHNRCFGKCPGCGAYD